VNPPREIVRSLPQPVCALERHGVVSIMGVIQIFAWGSSYYLLAVLAKPIAVDTGWPLTSVIGGLSLGLLVAGFVSPTVGRAIQKQATNSCRRFGCFCRRTGWTRYSSQPQ